MDRLSFLLRMAQQHPNDAEAIYWLAAEYAARGQWVDAIGQYSAVLAVCADDALRSALLAGLSEATARLQSGGGSAEQHPAAGNAGREAGAGSSESGAESPTGVGSSKSGIESRTGVRSSPPDSEEADDEDDEEIEVEDVADEEWETAQAGHAAVFARSGIGLQVLDGGKSAAASPADASHKVTFADVAGLQELKKTIQLRIISPFQNQGLFSKFRKKAGGGVLLYGPPGCGKTFMAKATAGECRAAFFPIHIADILDKYIGVSEQNLRDLFDNARAHKPSILFFDEIDTVGFNRSKSSSSMRGMIDTFLAEMEGIDTSTDQLLVIGATNMPWDVDDALKRPGRFDRLVFVAPPDEEAREHMFRLKLEGRYIENIDTVRLANRTEFFSGADIEHLCESAAERVLGEILESGQERPIRMSDFEALLETARPSTLEWLRKAKNYVKYANQTGAYNDVEDYLRTYGRRI
ncbi:ATP-binding protein [Paenibacillus thiaminolyticus]|uniref:ATP-binding protein n=1 Tax=Paenibacillus thiaminolyticus TaxID=49283 RepID=UPI00232FCDE7|nr:ATP-binding protein [Paenibacillus thiaminolyticus]WCF10818.1 ATP-binding protein [Paenibacillus thiaminolyticus]